MAIVCCKVNCFVWSIKPQLTDRQTVLYIATYSEQSRQQAQDELAERLRQHDEESKIHKQSYNANDCDMVFAAGRKYKITFDDDHFEDINYQQWEHKLDCKTITTPKLRHKNGKKFKDIFPSEQRVNISARIIRERSVNRMHQELPMHLNDWTEDDVKDFFVAYKKPVLTEAGDYLHYVCAGGHELIDKSNLLEYLTQGQPAELTEEG